MLFLFYMFDTCKIKCKIVISAILADYFLSFNRSG